MNRQEIGEIRQRFRYTHCNIDRVCGCYVNSEKKIVGRWGNMFLAMEEKEMLKYLDIFRKSLSGALEKTLYNMPFPGERLGGPGAEGRSLVCRAWESSLREEEALEELYGYIIDRYEYQGQYAILLAHEDYDIPGKTSDGRELEDASEEVYSYILCCICPVEFTRPGLGYNAEKECFTSLCCEKALKAPVAAVLYPAFQERSQDTGNCLCYLKTGTDAEKQLIEQLTGSRPAFMPEEERKAYKRILEMTLGRSGTLEEIRSIEERLDKLRESHREEPEPCKLDRGGLAVLLRDSGIDEGRIGVMERAFEEEAGINGELTPENLGNLKAFQVETEYGNITCRPEQAGRIEVREIDGERVLAVPIGRSLVVNGIEVPGT